MAIERLSQAAFVARGYGQVEPNHLSARRTGQIYAQLPAHKDINVLENGQFVKYDYANNMVNFDGQGEWMMVFNEVKLYENRQQYEDFAMIKKNYNARVYSPVGQHDSTINTSMNYEGEATVLGGDAPFKTGVPNFTYPEMMGEEVNAMVPRVIKTNVGDIFTTNTVDEETLVVGDLLTPSTTNGLLKKVEADHTGMTFAVVKVYTLADNQPAVKLQRIA